MAVASLAGCSSWLDLGYFQAHHPATAPAGVATSPASSPGKERLFLAAVTDGASRRVVGGKEP